MEDGTLFFVLFSLVMSMAHLFVISEHVALNCDMQYYICGKNYVVWLLQACRHTNILPCYFFWVLFDVSAFIVIKHSGVYYCIRRFYVSIALAFDHLERTILDIVLYIYKAKPSSWWDVWHKLSYNSVNQKKSYVWACYVWGFLTPCTPFLMKWYSALMHIWEKKKSWVREKGRR